jgi:Subtilase family
MTDFPRDRPHLFVNGGGQTEQYRRPAQAIRTPPLPVRDRAAHASALSASIGLALDAARVQLAERAAAVADGVPGFYLQIEVPAGEKAVIDKLGSRKKQIEVVAVRGPTTENPSVTATVFVPATADAYYQEKVETYRTQETPKGRPKNEPLIARMETVRLATARSLFTDDDALFPIGDAAVWWEIWLRDKHRDVFSRMAARLNLQIKDHSVRFPEREVVLVLANTNSINRLVAYSDVVAELRRAKDTPAFFMGLDGGEQSEWSDEALARVTPPADANVAVCILDSGVTQAHPLLSPALDIADLHTINPSWGIADSASQWRGHGTAMAGTALYGDLVSTLVGGGAIVLTHRLESVKILPPNGVAHNEPDLYGAITAEAIARAEIQAPNRRRAIALAVTSENSMRGKPSSWSSAIDQLCFDIDNRRLIILSAGNIRVDLMPADHLARNDLESVEDPAHAWNALTVGAFTEKVDIVDPTLVGWTAIATTGELSPRSRTSVTWDRQWPVKPDVVFEGGNLATDGVLPGDPVDDLQLLTTHNQPDVRIFKTFGDTSAATALVARLAGSILATRPRLWSETVRGLIVHSAEWTPAMRARINACDGIKSQIHALVRRYGYGVPDLRRALMSAQNDLTLMVEDALTPFTKEVGSEPKTRDMNVNQLPWPSDVLAQLGDVYVELRITLSYFIEPNPGERGWTRRHRYASHGLRFAVKKATESLEEFRARVNDAARDEENGEFAGGGGDEWLLGPKFRDQGSLHSDFWSGTAVDLAQRDAIGVFPVGGWWKEKPYLEKWDSKARYSLIVSIRAPGVEVDIYTPVENQISIAAVV